MMDLLERVIVFHKWLQAGEMEQLRRQVSLLWNADGSTRVRKQRE